MVGSLKCRHHQRGVTRSGAVKLKSSILACRHWEQLGAAQITAIKIPRRLPGAGEQLLGQAFRFSASRLHVTPDQNCGKCERGFVLWMFNPMFPNCEIWKQQQEFLSGRLYLPACADGHNVPHQIDPVYKMFYTECTWGYFFKLLCFGFIISVFW